MVHPTRITLILYINGELDEARTELVEAHLDTCSRCYNRYLAIAEELFDKED